MVDQSWFKVKLWVAVPAPQAVGTNPTCSNFLEFEPDTIWSQNTYRG